MNETELRLAVRQATKQKLYRARRTVSLGSRMQHYIEGSMMAAIVILCGVLLLQMPDIETVTDTPVQSVRYESYFPLEAQPQELVVDESLYCMTQNIFWEARNQSMAGQLAVGQVTMNRVASAAYPDTVCDVVYEHKQFSWYWDGKSDVPKDQESWLTAQLVASAALAGSGHVSLADVYHYHAGYVRPYWSPTMQLVARIGDHVFYDGGP